MPITKEMMKAWAENYEEAIDTAEGLDVDDLIARSRGDGGES
tara:strand:+ start:1159 stop:1284 length:126 start_codon:yes stop_codon:yes gene_type:complete